MNAALAPTTSGGVSWRLLLFTWTVHPIKCFLLETRLSRSLNQSSSTALSSSSSNALYSSCMLTNILNRSFNWASSSSTATKFLVGKSRPSTVQYFLCNQALIFSLLSFRVLSLNDFPFSVIVLNLLSGNSSLVLSVSWPNPNYKL